MKGVISTISLVLIVFIVLGMIAVAYIWGMPMIKKRTAVVNYESAENFAVRLDKAITDVVSAGGGQDEITIPFGRVWVIPYNIEDEDNNSIIIEFIMEEPLAMERSVIYLGSVTFADVTNETGIYGQSTPGIMTLTTEKQREYYLYRIKLHYRDLETFGSPVKGYKISLRSSQASGDNKVVISYGSTDVVKGGSPSGGDLTRTYVDVNVY